MRILVLSCAVIACLSFAGCASERTTTTTTTTEETTLQHP